MTQFLTTAAQVMPALMVAIVIEARYIMNSAIWKSQTFGGIRRFQSLVWALSLFSLWRSEIGIFKFLSPGSNQQINKENILFAINLSLLAIAFTPIMEVIIRGYHFLIAFFAIETPLFYRKFLNFLWIRNLSLGKYLLLRRGNQTIKRAEELLTRISGIIDLNPSIDSSVILNLKHEVMEIIDSENKRQTKIRQNSRFRADVFDKSDRRERVNVLSEKLQSGWLD